MGIRYTGLKLIWLRQNANNVTTVTWTSTSDLGTMLGGAVVSFQFRTLVIGGDPATYSLLSGTLPPNLSFDPTTGWLTGTLDNTGASYSFTIRATASLLA